MGFGMRQEGSVNESLFDCVEGSDSLLIPSQVTRGTLWWAEEPVQGLQNVGTIGDETMRPRNSSSFQRDNANDTDFLFQWLYALRTDMVPQKVENSLETSYIESKVLCI